MVATKLTGLAAFTPILTDIAYAVDDPGGTPISGKVTFSDIRDLLQANLTSATITGATLTGSAADSLINITQTWNTTGTPTAIKLNVTDTASNASSSLLDLQVGAAGKFRVAKNGDVHMAFGAKLYGNAGDLECILNYYSGGFIFGQWNSVAINPTNALPNVSVKTGGFICLSDNASAVTTNGAGAVQLHRDENAVLAQRNSTNAQAFRVYNTYTDASNYERAALRWNTNVFEIGSFAAGTGTLRGMMVGVSGNSLGFLGATPIAQYSTTGTTTGFTAGAGTAVLDDSTFTGNTGATAYTIGDVVRALKLYGLIAA